MSRHRTSQWTDEKEQELRELWATGLTSIEIAQRMGIVGAREGRSSVQNKARYMELPLRVNPNLWSSERSALLKKIYTQGSAQWLADEINKRTGSNFSRSAIIGRAQRLGLTAKHPRRVNASPIIFKVLDKRRAEPPPPPKDVDSLHEFDVTPLPDHCIGIPFSKLGPKQCRYSKGYGPTQLFCGQPTMERRYRIDGWTQTRRSSYCADCHARCWHPAIYQTFKSMLRGAA